MAVKMSNDWKEIEDVNQDCSESNGWCGFCWKCKEHSDYLHERDSWGDDE